MNRQQLRAVQHLPRDQFYKVITEMTNDEVERAKSFAYYNAWASVFSVLVDRWPGVMTGDMLHTIAVDTLEYVNGLDTPSELAEKLRQRTGFDIYQKPSDDSAHTYIEKGGEVG